MRGGPKGGPWAAPFGFSGKGEFYGRKKGSEEICIEKQTEAG